MLCKSMNYYFDHAASAKPFQEVSDLLRDRLADNFYNPSAGHSKGQRLQESIQRAKQNFLKLLSLKDGEFYFPPSATIANNLVVLGFNHKKDSEVLFFRGEHPSLVLPVIELEKRGVIVKDIAQKAMQGYDGENLLESLSKETTWLYLTSVNNQSGVANPVEKIALEVRLKFPHIKIHLDASQSLGKLSYDYSLFDTVTFSSHKCGGPKNIAGLWLKEPTLFSPLYFGGGQQGGLFSQTEDALLVEVFLLATTIGLRDQVINYERVSKMQQDLVDYLKSLKIPIKIPFSPVSPFITTFIIPDFPSDVVLRILEEKGCLLSSSSACSSKIKGFNPVFESLGIEEKLHKHVIRFSFGLRSTEEELDYFKKKFSEFVEENAFLIKLKKR